MKLANNTIAMETLSHEVLADTIIRNTNEIDGVRLASIPTYLCRIDENYQRPIDNAHVNELANPFNRIYANCLTVSYRDGYFYIIDGQHRFAAAKMNGIKALTCIVLTGLTSKQEAKIFKDLNMKHNSPNPYQLFTTNVWNGDPSDKEVAVDMHIKRICDKHNIEVRKFSRCSTGKVLRCLSRARWIVESTSYNGIECFEWIMDLINSTNWADVSDAYTKEIITMLKNFWIDNRGDAKLEQKLIEVINNTTPKLMIAEAKHVYSDYSTAVGLGLCLKDAIMGTNK